MTSCAAERDALRRFIADASHELRTPITALKSFIDLLQGPAAGDPQAQAEFLAESQAQIERLEWITRDLLDLSRLDAGLAALDRDEHDVGELIEAAAAAFKAQAREKGIALSLQPPQPALTLYCDRGRIEMALSNLVDNALKYTPAGGASGGGRRAVRRRACACGCAIPAAASRRRTRSAFSSALRADSISPTLSMGLRARALRAAGLDWRSSRASCWRTGGGCGWRASRGREACLPSNCLYIQRSA